MIYMFLSNNLSSGNKFVEFVLFNVNLDQELSDLVLHCLLSSECPLVWVNTSFN